MAQNNPDFIPLHSGTSGSRVPVQTTAPVDRPPLLVRLTGYRLLLIVTALAFCVPKGVLALQGQNAAPNALDLVFGILSLGLWWLGLYESLDPPVLPHLFHTDYSRQLGTALLYPLHLLARGVLSVVIVFIHVGPPGVLLYWHNQFAHQLLADFENYLIIPYIAMAPILVTIMGILFLFAGLLQKLRDSEILLPIFAYILGRT